MKNSSYNLECSCYFFSSSDDRLEGEDCSHPAASKAILLELRTNLYDYLVFVEVHGIGLFVARLG